LDSLPSPAQSPVDSALNAEIQQHVESALVQLTPMERTAFVLRHFEHRSMDEIGSALHLGRSAAKQAVFRAVQKLRRSLEPLLNPSK
jgi:RNA polymerase sigma-70 factor (ECF subfamily)